MIKTETIQPRKNMFEKKVTYLEPERVGKTALTKDKITSKYSESYQLNITRKALLGDSEALVELQEIEDYINAQLDS